MRTLFTVVLFIICTPGAGAVAQGSCVSAKGVCSKEWYVENIRIAYGENSRQFSELVRQYSIVQQLQNKWVQYKIARLPKGLPLRAHDYAEAAKGLDKFNELDEFLSRNIQSRSMCSLGSVLFSYFPPRDARIIQLNKQLWEYGHAQSGERLAVVSKINEERWIDIRSILFPCARSRLAGCCRDSACLKACALPSRIEEALKAQGISHYRPYHVARRYEEAAKAYNKLLDYYIRVGKDHAPLNFPTHNHLFNNALMALRNYYDIADQYTSVRADALLSAVCSRLYSCLISCKDNKDRKLAIAFAESSRWPKHLSRKAESAIGRRIRGTQYLIRKKKAAAHAQG
jgi:hypothetical protein